MNYSSCSRIIHRFLSMMCCLYYFLHSHDHEFDSVTTRCIGKTYPISRFVVIKLVVIQRMEHGFLFNVQAAVSLNMFF